MPELRARSYHFVVAVWRAKEQNPPLSDTGRSSPTISAKPDGVGAVSQRLIPQGERSGLLTHIARPRKAPLCSVELHRLETLVTGVVIPLLPCCAFSSALAQSPNLHSAVPRTSAPTPWCHADQQHAGFSPNILESMRSSTRDEDNGSGGRAHDAVAELEFKLPTHDVEELAVRSMNCGWVARS